MLLGDSGYACTPFLQTPYTHPRTRSEERFNEARKTTRCIIERTFGLVEIRMVPDRVCTIVAACFVLHNIALSLREPEIDDWDIDERDFDVEEQYHGPENAVRKHITDTFF